MSYAIIKLGLCPIETVYLMSIILHYATLKILIQKYKSFCERCLWFVIRRYCFSDGHTFWVGVASSKANLWMSQFLLGGLFGIDYHRKLTWLFVMLFLRMISFMFQGVVTWRRPNTYFYRVLRLHLCGNRCAIGLVFLGWTLILLQIIWCSLLTRWW